MRKEDCIFCKIVNGDIPSTRLYEDDDFVIMLDVGPASFGHALLVPKDHYENLFAMPEELLSKALILAKEFGEKLKNAMGADGLNLVQNNGLAAGQTVYHFHMHLIPRYEGDSVGNFWNPGELSQREKEEIIKKLG